MKKEQTHDTHKYFKSVFKTSGTIIYRCGKTGCPHFVYEPLIIGRLSICWRCGDTFEIMRKSIRNKKMHCEDCTRGRGKETEIKKLNENQVLNELLGD